MIKQIVPSEFCLECQGCCRFKEFNSVWLPCLLDEEIQDFLDRKVPPASISIDKKIQPVCDDQSNYICAFLNPADNRCKIYNFRPFECQLYPFLINLRGKKVVLTVDLNCPYAKNHINTAAFKEYVDYLTAYLNSPKQIRLLKDNPHILQVYDEVAEIIELKSDDKDE